MWYVPAMGRRSARCTHDIVLVPSRWRDPSCRAGGGPTDDVDGTRTPVSESEEIDRWSGVRMLPGNPVVECAVTDPEEASEGVA